MPSGLPISRWVICSNSLAPSSSNSNATCGWFERWSNATCGVRAEILPGQLLLGAVEAGRRGDLPLAGGRVLLAEVELGRLADELLRLFDVLDPAARR